MSEQQPPTNFRNSNCVPCEGGVPRLSVSEATNYLKELSGWVLLSGPDRIQKSWTVENFLAAIDFFQRIADLAEHEGHHPDLHLSRYRCVSIEIWTHAVDGLSLNDFILAARIDELPVRLRIPRKD
jgi:4a-hydroxytetrahydrobiopterin dehydratase